MIRQPNDLPHIQYDIAKVIDCVTHPHRRGRLVSRVCQRIEAIVRESSANFLKMLRPIVSGRIHLVVRWINIGRVMICSNKAVESRRQRGIRRDWSFPYYGKKLSSCINGER